MKSTFNINTGHFGDELMVVIPRHVMTETEVRETYQDMEVAAHGYNHMSMTDCPINCAAADVGFDVVQIEKIFGKKVKGFANTYDFGHSWYSAVD